MIKDGKDDMRQAFQLPKEFRERPCTFCAAQRLAEDFGLVQGDWSSAPVPWILTFSTTCACGGFGQSKVYARVLWWYSLGLWSEHSRNSANCWEAPGNSQWNIAMWTRVFRVWMDEAETPLWRWRPEKSTGGFNALGDSNNLRELVEVLRLLWRNWMILREWCATYTVCNMYSLFNIIINMLLYWFAFINGFQKRCQTTMIHI